MILKFLRDLSVLECHNHKGRWHVGYAEVPQDLNSCSPPLLGIQHTLSHVPEEPYLHTPKTNITDLPHVNPIHTPVPAL